MTNISTAIAYLVITCHVFRNILELSKQVSKLHSLHLNVAINFFTAKNPSPLCFPIPGILGISFCIRLYNVFTPGKNIHACIDFETRFAHSPILILHFDCLRLGADGVAWLKPEDNGGLQTESYSPSPVPQHDQVDFESDNITQILCANATTLSPIKQNNVGQWKD